MSNPVRIARYGGVHADLTVTITPLLGPYAHVPITLRTVTTMNHDLAPKYAAVGGTQIAPVNLVLAGSAPKWDGEMNMIEATEVQRKMGPGWAGIPINVQAHWRVSGNPQFSDFIYGTYLGPCSIASKKDDIVKAKIGAECTAIHPRGIDPFAQRPGGP